MAYFGLKCAYLRADLMNFEFKDVYLALKIKYSSEVGAIL